MPGSLQPLDQSGNLSGTTGAIGPLDDNEFARQRVGIDPGDPLSVETFGSDLWDQDRGVVLRVGAGLAGFASGHGGQERELWQADRSRGLGETVLIEVDVAVDESADDALLLLDSLVCVHDDESEFGAHRKVLLEDSTLEDTEALVGVR